MIPVWTRDLTREGKCRDEKDGQRQKVYDAERAALKGREGEKVFETKEEIKDFVNNILNNDEFKAKYPEFDVSKFKLSFRKTGTAFCQWSNWGRNRINIPMHSSFYRRDWVIVHEMAHAITTHRIKGYASPLPAHGAKFCADFLDLTKMFLGEEAYKKLKRAFNIKGIQYAPYFYLPDEETFKAATMKG